MLADRLGDGEEDDSGLLQLLAEGGRDGNAVEHRVDRDLGRAFDSGEHLLLFDRDAELLVGAADFGIELIEALQLRLRLGRGVIISVLVIDLGDVELGPGHFLHLEPGAIGLEPPVEHPLGLVLLGRDEADRVFAEALGRELLLDVGDEAPFVVLRNLFAQLAILDGFVHCASSVRLTAPRAPRTALPTIPMCGLTRQWASSAQSVRPSEQTVIAIGPSTASTMSARVISTAGLARANPPAAPRALERRPQPASWHISFCAVGRGTPVSPASSVALRRAPAGRRAAAVIRTTA